ncbi:MAG TPA: copper resistance protein CopC [Candidatus Bathyarchaeia archaeon]|nr:copper resistance protein CopC [Candidatus Bathyarchaeia archaeon]
MSKRVGDKCNYCRYLPIIIIASLLFLSYALISTIPHVYAHAYVIGSDPYPSQSLPKGPSNVIVHLSEPVDIRYSSVKVLGPGGNQIDKKDSHYVNGDHTTLAVTLPAALKDGVYTVSTKMLSETDGHVTENAFVFGVGHAIIPSSVPNTSAGLSSLLYIPEAIARFPTLVGQVIIVGGAFATLWLWRPIARIDWLANTLGQVQTKINKRIAILMVIGAAILLASDFGMIYAEAKSIDISILDAIGTKFGSLWIYRLVTSIVLMCLSVLLFLNQRKNKGGRIQKSIIYGLLGVGLIALLTTSLIGHGAALNPASVPILIDFVHNLAASLWIGGVIYLAFVVVPGIKQAHKDEYIKASLLSLLIPRFSTIPVVILGVIVITGPFLLYLLEPNLGLTLASLYGKALITKLILAGVMIGIGAYNQSIIHRDSLKMVAVTSIASGSDASQKKGSESTIDARRGSIDNVISKFGKSTKAEAFVGIALLAAVAVLVNTGLPASEFQGLIQQVQQQQQSIPGLNFANGIATPQQGFTATNYIGNNQKVTLSINPYIPGNNKFQIVYSDSNGNPVDIKSVQLRYTQTDKGIGPITVDTDKVSKGIFSVNAAFGLAGPWDLQVEATPAAVNSPDIVTEYNLFVKPKLSDFSFNVKEYKMPSNNAQPLFLLYDKSRNVVWTGDSSINSGRIWEFSLTNHTYTEHKIAGANIITLMAFDPTNNDIWFIDPLNKNLGHYNPATGRTQLFKIPVESVLSGIAIDPSSTNIWVSLATANEVLRFNILEETFSTPIKLPTQNATPLGIIADQSGQIWVAESGTGKLANIDPTKNNKVTEFVPTGGVNNTVKSPTALLADPNSGQIYISEHDGHTVSVFNPILQTFSKNPPLNPSGLPFGMALDNYRNLWVAEHVINKIAVIDPSTGEHSEVAIPQQSPFVQWITSDSQGNIWMAEQRAASLGQITIIAKPSLSGLAGSQIGSSPAANSNNGNKLSLPTFGFSYAEVVGPSVAAGIVVSALFYAKTIIDLKRSEQLIRKTAKVTRS